MAAPAVTLSNGQKIPRLGLGTWQAKPGEVAQAVIDAIDIGYRHFDCAMLYGNETEIGEGIRQKIADGTVTREELFITSKLWNTFHRPELVVPTCKKTLENFGLDYVDLYLVHWPLAFQAGGEYFPRDNSGTLLHEDVDFRDTYRKMEECVKLGYTRSIGLSNFNSRQIDSVMEMASVRPVMNQVECHPYLNQKKLTAYCKEHGMAVTAYSPLGAPNAVFATPGTPNLLDDARLKQMADKYGRTLAQIVLRYLVQIDVIPIPKSTNKNRLKENISIFDFEISEEDMKVIDSFNCNARTCPFVESKDDPNYPFDIEF